MKWIVKRYLIEHFEIEGDSRKEAFDNLGKMGSTPHRVELLKETAKKV